MVPAMLEMERSPDVRHEQYKANKPKPVERTVDSCGPSQGRTQDQHREEEQQPQSNRPGYQKFAYLQVKFALRAAKLLSIPVNERQISRPNGFLDPEGLNMCLAHDDSIVDEAWWIIVLEQPDAAQARIRY